MRYQHNRRTPVTTRLGVRLGWVLIAIGTLLGSFAHPAGAEREPIQNIQETGTDGCADFSADGLEEVAGFTLPDIEYGSISKNDPDDCFDLVLGGSYSRVYGTLGQTDDSNSARTIRYRLIIDGATEVDKTLAFGQHHNFSLDVDGAIRLRIRVDCASQCNSSGTTYPAIAGTAIIPEDLIDIPETGGFRSEILWAVGQGITEGYENGTFRGKLPITRGAMAAFLYRMQGEPPGNYPNPGFWDVSTDHVFYDAIAWAANKGIVAGYDDDGFHPQDVISRQSAAAMLHRLAGSPEGPFPDPGFADVSPDHPFFAPIAWMAEEEITSGYADGNFRPTEKVTRQSIAAYLYRYKH